MAKPEHALEFANPCDISEYAIEQACHALDYQMGAPFDCLVSVAYRDAFKAARLAATFNAFYRFNMQVFIDESFDVDEWMVTNLNTDQTIYSPGA